MRVKGAIPELGGPYDLYRFTGVDPAQMEKLIFTGPYPWWTKPDIRAGFFRPLSSALIHFDVRVIGDHVNLWHLHSIAWYLALVALVLALYRRSLPLAAAPVAIFFFAIDDAHWMPVGWLANRNSLVSAVPALGGVLLHLKWREDGFRPGLPLSMLAYATGLLGGESALGVLGFVFAYELTNVRGEAAAKRARALVPLLAVAATWAVAYKLLGYGARGSAIYIDPLGEPVEYLSVAPGRVLALLGSLTLGVNSDLWMFMSKGRYLLGGLGLAGCGVFALFLRRARACWDERQWRHLRWLIVSGLFAVLPVAATFPADRLLLIPSIASGGLVGALLHALWREAGRVPKAARAMLIVTQGVMPLPAWAVSPYFLRSAADYVEEGVMQAEVSDAALGGNVLLITAPDPLVGMYGSLARMLHGKPAPASWHFLTYAPYEHRLKRVAQDAFELEVLGGRMLGTVFEQLFRAPRFPLEPGFTVTVATMKVTVLDAVDGQPTKLRAELTKPIETLTLLQWKNGRLAPLALPPVGEERVLAHELGPIDKLMDAFGGR